MTMVIRCASAAVLGANQCTCVCVGVCASLLHPLIHTCLTPPYFTYGCMNLATNQFSTKSDQNKNEKMPLWLQVFVFSGGVELALGLVWHIHFASLCVTRLRMLLLLLRLCCSMAYISCKIWLKHKWKVIFRIANVCIFWWGRPSVGARTTHLFCLLYIYFTHICMLLLLLLRRCCSMVHIFYKIWPKQKWKIVRAIANVAILWWGRTSVGARMAHSFCLQIVIPN